MRVVIQRVRHASVTIDGNLKSAIQGGLLVLVGIEGSDNQDDIEWLCKKIVNLRIFDDENGVMNKSVLDINGEVLSISQFTLYADTKKGHRPSYVKALDSIKAKELYKIFNERLGKYVCVETGVFGADMLVNIKNDGPVTILLERERKYDKK